MELELNAAFVRQNLIVVEYVSFLYLFKLIDRVDVVFIGSFPKTRSRYTHETHSKKETNPKSPDVPLNNISLNGNFH